MTVLALVTFVIAVLGTFVVAWQAYETHRTTNLSHRTLAASHSLAIDSARSRLDHDAPRIDVYVEQVSVLPGEPGDPADPANLATAEWHLPADAGRMLSVQAQVRVVNLMPHRTIHLKVSGLHDPAMRADTEVLLIPSASLAYFLTATFTLSQWAENWAAHHAGRALPHIAEGRVTAGDDRDEGVVDTWPLRLAARPVEPASDLEDTDGAGTDRAGTDRAGTDRAGAAGRAGTWEPTSGGTGDDWFRIAIRPLRERSYWISQRRNIPMPEPSTTDPPSFRPAQQAPIMRIM